MTTMIRWHNETKC